MKWKYSLIFAAALVLPSALQAQTDDKTKDAPERRARAQQREQIKEQARKERDIPREEAARAMEEAQQEIKKVFSSRPVQAPFGTPGAPALPAMPSWSGQFQFNSGPEISINLDLENQSVRDAIKNVLQNAKQEFIFDNDLKLDSKTVSQMDAKITLRIPNVPLSTALDLLTRTASINWAKEVRIAKDCNEPKVLYHVSRVPRGSAMAVFSPGAEGNKQGGTVWQMNTGGMNLSANSNDIRRLINVMIPEERSAFTCPHCHRRVVAIIKKSVTTRRGATSTTTTSGAWKYCPLCGKSIDLEDSSDARELLEKDTVHADSLYRKTSKPVRH
jgi:hypothetical protein